MWQSRTKGLIGEDNVNKLNGAKIIVFGVGGVGGHAIESLARAGVGTLTIVDKDVVDITNINRQIVALFSTVNISKVQVMKQRLLDINPNIKVTAIQEFVTEENLFNFKLNEYDFVVDAIDNVTAKIAIAKECFNNNIRLISCMGTGNKLCPEMFEIADINSTSVCPLCKVVRKKLKELKVNKLTVLYSKEQPVTSGERTPASISFSPSIAGIRIAEYVIKQLLSI